MNLTVNLETQRACFSNPFRHRYIYSFLDEFTIKTVEQLSLAFPVVTRDYGRFAVLKKISQPMGKISNGEKL